MAPTPVDPDPDPEPEPEPENPYYSVFSSDTTTVAPGVTQTINYALTTDEKQIVYYIATVDISREDVSVHANYHANDPSQGWAMARVTDQMAAAQAREEKRRTRRALDAHLRSAALGRAAQRAQVTARHAERERGRVEPVDVPEFNAARGAEIQHSLGIRALSAHTYAAAQQLDGFFQHTSLISHIPPRRSYRRCAARCLSCCAASVPARVRAE